ncbi:MAG: DNA replication/repair protein RecF [Clostridia bacterium]|nr:DNA replication/repair protein RecF [Clostridia bacterium]
MRVLDLNCNNFRNINEGKIIPCEEMNVICGENAQGKTNFLEAIWLFTGAKSFRGSKDIELIKFGKEKASINMNFISKEIEMDAQIEIKEKRNFYLNSKKVKSSSEFAGNFNAIIFSPTDLKLVSEGPVFRRKFLDTAIGQSKPAYIEILKNYMRAVTQRNKIIKDFKYDKTLSIMLDVFENEIAENGQKIINLRKNYIEKLNPFLTEIYSGISSGKENLDIEYISNSKNNLEEKLKLAREEDMYSGVTSIGPHRDDLDFKINGFSARSYASQGQKRSVSLSLKLAEAKALEKDVGECPLFLLDDVMSELDPERQNFILNHIRGMQAFITCCDPSNIKNLKDGKIINIKDGRVV